MKVHFIGIGGIGVSALAHYYLAKGAQVSGSDLVYSEILDSLKKEGAEIFIGKHSERNLRRDTDLVIYSPAVKSDNPEIKKAKKLKIQIQSYPQALGELTRQYFTIAVCGTHGKSTTTAMIALILVKSGLDPTVIIGTKLNEFGRSNFRAGKSKYLVIEADEHFASFLNYSPKIIVLTNIEADHLDYYKNLSNYIDAFRKFINSLPDDGFLVINRDDKNSQKIFNMNEKKKTSKKIDIEFYSFKDKEVEKLREILQVPGRHNIYNALAALKAARILGISDKQSFDTLSRYRGSWRRFEIKEGEINNKNFILISDYGHHPTEIKSTLEGAREKFSSKKIILIFQPHQYQRTYYLFNNFVDVFRKGARDFLFDKAIIIDIYDVVGREDKKIKEEINAEKLVKKINSRRVIYLPKEEIKDWLINKLKGGEVVILMGAGDIYDLESDFSLDIYN